MLYAPVRLARSALRGERQQASQDDSQLWALKDVSFEVRRGEVMGIIGRNGAGKSTLLKILSRITRPTEGRVGMRGRVGSLLEVGTGFHPELTGRENIYLNGAMLGMRRAEIVRKFDEIVAFAEVERFIDTPVKHYSSGMYMRLAFAVAAHLEPEILVVDEVLAVGDAAFQKKCLGKMGEVAKEGRTVLFVSHNMAAVEQLCRHILWLDHGRIATISTDIKKAIHQYLITGNKEHSSSEWINNGTEYQNPWFVPLQIALVNRDGSILEQPIHGDEEVWVQIKAKISQLNPSLIVGYALYTQGEQLLYWTYQTDTPEAQWPSLQPGWCTLLSKIPAKLLNEGEYRLEIIGGLHPTEWLFEPATDVPSIRFTLQGGLSNSPHWMQRRPGILAPVISWSLTE